LRRIRMTVDFWSLLSFKRLHGHRRPHTWVLMKANHSHGVTDTAT
jgi:hypothetical protein